MRKFSVLDEGEKTSEFSFLETEEETEEAKYNEKLYCNCGADINDMIKVDGANIEGIGYVKKEGWFCPHCHRFINFEELDEDALPDSIDKTLHKNYDMAEIVEFKKKENQ